MNKKNVLAVTGLSGKKSGGVFCEELSKNLSTINELFPGGVRAICRETTNIENARVLIPELQVNRGDFTDEEFLKKAFVDVDTLVHIVGIHWSVPVVNAAADAGVRRLILVHTTGIYSKYKEAGEEYRQIDEHVYDVCRKNQIKLTICRPTMIYGRPSDNNMIKFIRMVDKLPLMPVVNGARYELQPVNYKDLGNAYYQILVNENATVGHDYNLSGDKPILLRDIFTMIGQILGKKVHFISCPFPIAYFGAWVVYVFTLGKKDYREKVQRLCEPRTFSHEPAFHDFGYTPMTIEEGLREEIEEYKAMK